MVCHPCLGRDSQLASTTIAPYILATIVKKLLCMKTVSYRDSTTSVPVGKILCLGRNYAKHAEEMSSEVPETPVVFLKPSTALLSSGQKVSIPSFSSEMHHEVELVVLMDRSCRNISEDSAYQYIGGYGVGLDMTLRDVQTEAKKKGQPWSVAKGFDSSAPVSSFVGKEHVADPHALLLSLEVNGEIRQQSSTGNMIFRIDAIVAYLSSVFTLEAGDLIFTGTPEGVGPVYSGDVLEAELKDVARCRVEIA